MDAGQVIVFAVVALAVLAFVVGPLVARGSHAARGTHVVDPERIEARILEYRAALRRRTVCEHCLYAGPAGSRYCAECGSRLPAAQ